MKLMRFSSGPYTYMGPPRPRTSFCIHDFAFQFPEKDLQIVCLHAAKPACGPGLSSFSVLWTSKILNKALCRVSVQ